MGYVHSSCADELLEDRGRIFHIKQKDRETRGVSIMKRKETFGETLAPFKSMGVWGLNLDQNYIHPDSLWDSNHYCIVHSHHKEASDHKMQQQEIDWSFNPITVG